MRSRARILASVPLLLIVTVLIGAVGFIKSDYAARRICTALEDGVRERFGLDVEVERCEVDLLPPALDLRRIQLAGDGRSRLLDVAALRIELNSLALLSGAFELERLSIREPSVFLVLGGGRLVNLPPLKSAAAGGGQGPVWASESMPAEVEIEGGRLHLVIEEKGLLQLRDVGAALRSEGQQLDVTAAVGSGSLELAGLHGTSLRIEGGKLKASARADSIELSRLALDVGGCSISGSGEIRALREPAGPDPRLRLTASGPVSLISRLLPAVPEMAGQAMISADTSRGEGGGLQASGRLEVVGFGIAAVSGVDLKTAFSLEAAGLALDGLQASSRAGAVSGSVRLALAQPFAFSGQLELAQADLAKGLALGGLDFEAIDLHGPGSLSFQGQFASSRGPGVTLQLDLDAERFGVKGSQGPVLCMDGARLRVTGDFSGKRVRLPSIRILRGESRFEGDGQIRFGGGSVSASLRASPLDLGDLSPLAGLDLTGRGELTASVSGAFPVPEIELDLQLDDMHADGLPIGSLRGKVGLNASGLFFRPLRLLPGTGRIVLSGELGLEPPHRLACTAELSGVGIAALANALGGGPGAVDGVMAGRVEAGGSLASPTLDFQVGFAGLRLGPQLVEEGGAIGRYEDGAWQLQLLEARLGPGWIFAQGGISRDLGLDLTAYSTGLRAASLFAFAGRADWIDFRVDLHTSVKGPLLSPALEGWAKVYDTEIRGHAVEDSFVSTRVTTESVRVEGRFLGGMAILSGRMDLIRHLPFEAELLFGSGSLGRFLPDALQAAGPSLELRGALRSTGRLLQPHSVRADLELDRAQLKLAKLDFHNRGPVQLSLTGDRFKVGRCEIRGMKTRLRLQGSANRSGAALTAEGALDFGLLPLATALFPLADGEAQLRLSLTGPWSGLRFSGSAALSADRLRVRGLPADLEDVEGAIELSPRQVEVTRIQGRLGGGRFSVRGGLGLAGLRPEKLALTIELDRVRLDLSRKLWALGSGTLGLIAQPGSRPKLSGELQLHEGGYEEQISLVTLSNGLFRRRRPYARTYDPDKEVVDFDVRLLAPEKFQLVYDLELAKLLAEMKGELRLTGSNERLGLLGEMEALEGSVSYLSKAFHVDSARVRFVDEFGIQPRYEIVASRTEVVDRDEGETSYSIGLRLAGDAEGLKIELQSSPLLDERDIITLLSLGVTSRDVDSLRSDDLFGLGGEIFIRSFKLDERMNRLFPFPREVIQPKYFRLRSRFSARTGTAPRLETGVKLRLISDNLDLDYSRSLFDDTDQSLDLSYRLSRSISARMRWEDSQEMDLGDLGLDLKLDWEW
ncbi:MAG: translocation/assembly module TamB domain-containing protein [Deltaproteobacteria bacterium]|nr:translocation/assembly module TamB domain-containing protein [Deltaproteobacteria bacterium]